MPRAFYDFEIRRRDLALQLRVREERHMGRLAEGLHHRHDEAHRQTHLREARRL